MNNRFILIAGSASTECSQESLDVAILFLRCFTNEVLSRGGGLVVLAGDEAATRDEHGTPHIFDWVVLREIARYAESTTGKSRTYVRIVMSDSAVEEGIDDANLRLLANLEQRNVVEVLRIRREKFTGGEYRQAQVEMADGMLAIGGGKGTYSIGSDTTDLGKPVLPLDLRLGSLSDDGDGAIALHRHMISSPGRFFPRTHADVSNRIGLIGLDRRINDVRAVARVAAEMFEQEFDATPGVGWRARGKRQLEIVLQSVKALPIVSAAIKIVEFILR